MGETMIYILERTDEIGWDEYTGKVVRAESEQEARDIANKKTGDEGKIWTDTTKVTCEQVATDGASGAILEAFNAG